MFFVKIVVVVVFIYVLMMKISVPEVQSLDIQMLNWYGLR